MSATEGPYRVLNIFSTIRYPILLGFGAQPVRSTRNWSLYFQCFVVHLVLHYDKLSIIFSHAWMPRLCSTFQAANPGAEIEDFIRWHSPRDWIEEEVVTSDGCKMAGKITIDRDFQSGVCDIENIG